MQKIIYAFVGMNHSFSLPFNFGENHLDAFRGYLSEFEHHNDVKLSKKEKIELKKDVAYGYITYDSRDVHSIVSGSKFYATHIKYAMTNILRNWCGNDALLMSVNI